MSFFADKVVSEGLTFDDVLLIPSYSEVLPREVDLSSWFSRNIRLSTPIVTAAMDTVTESETAIALARDNNLPIIVFSLDEPGGFCGILAGNGPYTRVHG